jgi:anti-anti-sigma factor
MKTDFVDDGGRVIATVAGRLDAATAGAFDAAFKDIPGLTPARSVLFDLGSLEFVSSAGLRSLLSLAKALKATGAELAFCSLNDMVADVFRISGFTSIFKTYPDRQTALSSFLEDKQ